MNRRSPKTLLSTDSLVSGLYWIFWIAVFTLAVAELLYLVRGYSDFGIAVAAALPAVALKYYVGVLDTERVSDLRRELRNYKAFTRNALVWSGPSAFRVSDTGQLDEGLAFGVVISSTIGFEAYNADYEGVSFQGIVTELLPPEVREQLGHIKELEKIDRSLRHVATRLGSSDNRLLHDIRVIILDAVFELTKNDKDAFEREFASALQTLAFKAHKTPPIQRLIAATKAEYEGIDSSKILIGDWKIVASWITSPPTAFEDLLGDAGLPIPVPPKESYRTYDG